MKTRKRLRVALMILLAVLVVVVVGVCAMFKDELSIALSIKKGEGTARYYTMRFPDGYHLDEMLGQDISSDQELAQILAARISHGFYKPSSTAESHIGCSTLACTTADGREVWGRNFDWYYSTPIVVLATPHDGYASISTCEFSNITGEADSLPEGVGGSFLAIAAYFVPMDGVNDQGLCVAELEVNEGGQVLVDTERPNITTTMAIRLLLDRAATVDEAVELLQGYDVCPSGGISAHLAISDRTGKAVVVEFVDGEMKVVSSPVATNFCLSGGDIAAGGEVPRSVSRP